MMSPLCGCFPSFLREDTVTRRPLIGMGAPAYLDVPKLQDCLVFKNFGTYSFHCLPAARPAKCPKASWKKLVTDDDSPKCADMH